MGRVTRYMLALVLVGRKHEACHLIGYGVRHSRY